MRYICWRPVRPPRFLTSSLAVSATMATSGVRHWLPAQHPQKPFDWKWNPRPGSEGGIKVRKTYVSLDVAENKYLRI